MQKIMFDSNVFDRLPRIIDRIKKSAGTQYEYYVTTIQVQELCEIPDWKKGVRITNVLMLADLRARLVPLSVFILNGKARLGYSRLGSGAVYRKILNSCHSNIDDAAIADTAVFEGCILVTEDKDLHRRMSEHGYEVMHLADFLEALGNSPGLQLADQDS